MFTHSDPGECLIRLTGLFFQGIHDRHKLCIRCVMPDLLHVPKVGAEPTPNFPTDAEIELAEQLRQQLEKQYLGRSTALSSVQSDWAKTSESDGDHSTGPQS